LKSASTQVQVAVFFEKTVSAWNKCRKGKIVGKFVFGRNKRK